MCLVEVKPGPPKPQASCALPAAEGQAHHIGTVLRRFSVNCMADRLLDSSVEYQSNGRRIGYSDRKSSWMRTSSVSSGWKAVARMLPWRRPTT